MKLNDELIKFMKDKGAVEIDVIITSVNEKEGITERLIDELIETYNPEKFEVPNVLGHPPFKDQTPAYGWVKKLFKRGKDLIQRASLLPELVEMIKKGMFKKRSIAWYLPKHPSNPYPGKNTLAHVGWLGAVPPAIKGMPNAKLSEDIKDLKIVEFSEGEREVKKLKEEKLMEFTQEQLDDRVKTKVSEVTKELSDKHEIEIATLSDEKKDFETQIKILKTDIETKDKEIEIFAEKEFEHEVEKAMLSELKLKIIPANKEKVSAQLLKMRKLSEADYTDLLETYKAQPDVIKLGKNEEAEGEPNAETLTEDDKDFDLDEKDIKKYGKDERIMDKKKEGE